MPDRKGLVLTLWLSALLAMLAAAASAPIVPHGPESVAASPESALRNLHLPPSRSTVCLNAAMATDAVVQVSALPTDIEEQEQDWAEALDETRVTFLLPCSFRKVVDRQSIVPRSILSHYPIRC